MKILESNKKAMALYSMATAKKADITELPEGAIITVDAYAITEGKYQDGLILQVGDLFYFTNDRPLVDSFNTIKSCFGNIPKLAFAIKTSNTTGKQYRIFIPVED